MNTAAELQQFGISEKVTRVFNQGAKPELLDYLDLLPHKSSRRDADFFPDGAIESDHRPLLYYVNHTRLSESPADQKEQLSRLNRNLASRGERAYLAILQPGLLKVVPVKLDPHDVPQWKEFRAGTNEAINFYSNLAHANLTIEGEDEPDLIFAEMYKLLTEGADTIRSKIGKDNVLSLVGRALFFRFLCDRKIVTAADTSKICPSANDLKACFDNSKNSYYSCRWLDQTFNGDFLPFREKATHQFFDELNRSKLVFPNLKAIVRGLEPLGNSQFQHRFTWADFNFAHVPVGLLSQVYEAFCWKWDEANSRETSVHYTPRNIATTLVEEAFDALENPSQARVLDPACGAGVFLVLAFRRLYLEHWRATGNRPDTNVIRNILETQLTGFDISDPALKLTALSLYLTAIELDPNPIPPEKLRFDALDGKVLFNHRRKDDRLSGAVIGSLKNNLGHSFDEKFDLVLCNPPWSRIDNKHVASELETISKEIISKKNETLGKEYSNPQCEPDLPFVWKATEWCRRGGQIAMVLPSRILFRQGKTASHARETVFRLIRFTGVVNCSNVRKTNVWPKMNQPFMLVFARNQIPPIDSSFWFVSPQSDYSLNRKGCIRIDAHSAHILEVDDVLEENWMFKALTIGTWLDVEVVRRIRHAADFTVQEYWEDVLHLTSKKGYTIEGRGENEKAKLKDASLLRQLPDAGIANKQPHRYTIDISSCQPFTHEKLWRTLIDEKSEDPLHVYRGPLLLLKKSLPKDRKKGVSLSCYNDIAFNQSYYGYSAHEHPQSKLLIQYLHTFAHSQIWTYVALCSSPGLGAERPVFLKSDFGSCPIVSFESLTSQQQSYVSILASRLDSEDDSVFNDIDVFFGNLFGLTKHDNQVISDTLTVRNPHDELGIRASTPPDNIEVKQFVSVLRSSLNPFARKVGQELNINVAQISDRNLSFRFIIISSYPHEFDVSQQLQQLVLDLADRSGVSIIVHEEGDVLLVGILNQYRYWTESRARLLGADLLRDHFTVFEESK